MPLRSLRAAETYLEEHLAEPISIGDIARAAGVSVRTLQRGFTEHLDTTPQRYLALRRLARAHQDLLDAAQHETVADIAYRWGFGHLSRFAAAYRRQYGQAPSATLRNHNVS